MSHLSDMEELIQKISNQTIADYMKEALQCYSAGAYRGCIVLSCIALFDDCVNKLAEIRDLNNEARKIHDEVVRRQKNQDVYESYLLDHLTKHKIISELDSSTAEVIKNRRNKSAHASGHKPSAEEARFIYYEVVDKFLSKLTFSSKVLADEILNRLKNKSFFHASTIDQVKSVLEHELKLLHKDAYPYLMAKLIDGVRATDVNVSHNSRLFLDGLSSLNIEDWNKLLVDKLLEKKLDDENYRTQCLVAISINPSLLQHLTPTSMKRLKLAINKNTDEQPNSSTLSSPAQFFESIQKSNPATLELLEEECFNFLNKHSYISISPTIASSTPTLWGKYEKLLLSKAGSNDFDTANNFSRSFKAIENGVVESSSNEFLFDLSIAIIKAAEWGAWASESIVSDKFSKFSALKEKIIEFIDQNQSAAEELVKTNFPSCKSTSIFLNRYIVVKSEKV